MNVNQAFYSARAVMILHPNDFASPPEETKHTAMALRDQRRYLPARA